MVSILNDEQGISWLWGPVELMNNERVNVAHNTKHQGQPPLAEEREIALKGKHLIFLFAPYEEKCNWKELSPLTH